MLASCGKEVKIHEWPDGSLIGGVSTIHGVTFKGLSWSNSGNKLLAVPSGHNPILLKECSSNENSDDVFFADILKGLNDGIECGIFPNTVDNYLTIGLITGDIMAYDVVNQSIVRTYTRLSDPVVLLDYTYNDILLTAGCKDGKIYFYDSNGFVNVRIGVPSSTSVSSLMFHPKSDSFLLAGSKEGVLAGWDVNTFNLKFDFKSHEKDVADICVTNDDLLISVSSDQKILFYDLRTNSIVNNVTFGMDLTAVAYSKQNEDIIIGTSEGRMICFDKRQPSKLKYSFDSQKNSPVKNISFSSGKSLDLTSKTSSVKTNQSLSVFKLGDFIKSDFLLPKSELNGNLETEGSQFNVIPIGEGNEVPYYQLVEENSLRALKQEIINTNKEIMRRFMDDITDQFLKIRLEVSREFCHLEQKQNKKWREFHNKLSKLSAYERKEHDASDSQISLESFRVESSKRERKS